MTTTPTQGAELVALARELSFSMKHSAGQWMVPGWDGYKVSDLLDKLAAALRSPGQQAGEPSEWISVEDQRKPELDQVILMWVWAEDECEDDDGNYYPQDVSQVQMGVYRDMGHGPFFDCFATPFADHEGVGYWMPLPKAPARVSIDIREDAA